MVGKRALACITNLGDNVLRIKSISYEKKCFIGDFCSK